MLHDNLIGIKNVLDSENSVYLFGALRKLKTLNLSSNRISQLDSGVFWNLNALIRLDLKDNLSTDWNATLHNLKYLRFLDLSQNQVLHFLDLLCE